MTDWTNIAKPTGPTWTKVSGPGTGFDSSAVDFDDSTINFDA